MPWPQVKEYPDDGDPVGLRGLRQGRAHYGSPSCVMTIARTAGECTVATKSPALQLGMRAAEHNARRVFRRRRRHRRARAPLAATRRATLHARGRAIRPNDGVVANAPGTGARVIPWLSDPSSIREELKKSFQKRVSETYGSVRSLLCVQFSRRMLSDGEDRRTRRRASF